MFNRWTIHVRREALAKLYKIPRNIVAEVTNTIHQLAHEPLPQTAKSIDTTEDIWSIQAHGYEIAYTLDKSKNWVIVLNVREVDTE